MDPSSGQQHHQQMANNNNNESLESMMMGCTKQEQQQQEKKPRPQPEQALKCPRCDSTNTKFCYYNNYSLSQPRYFCKSCRRYWTKGGTLRNVPVGGGCRKNKRSSSKRAQDQLPFNPDHNPLMNSLPPLSYDSEFTLALARLQKQTGGVHLGLDDHHDLSMLVNHTNTNTNTTTQQQQQQGFLDALRSNGFNTNNTMHSDHLYYGGNGDMGEVYNEIMLPYEQEMSVETTQAVTVTTTKQELCNVSYNCNSNSNNNNNNHKVLWGFPWQINGETNMLGDIDLSRASWNGNAPLTTPLSWHGLLNSPLM